MKKLKIIIVIILGILLVSGISAYATYTYLARDVEYTKSNGTKISVEAALNELYKTNPSDEVNTILNLTNKKIALQDLYTESFMAKVSNSKQAAKIILDDENFRNQKSLSLVEALDVGLVNNVVDNTNIIYSSEYGNEFCAKDAFKTETCWCNANGDNTPYIGYNFGNAVNVRIVSFYNGGTQNYPLKKVKLQCSSDNVTWVDASDEYTFEDKTQTVFVYNTKTDESYQYWRIYSSESHRTWKELNRLQFYGI